ncbi:N-acetylmuramoyl-L-alanine amidase [Thalassobacillus sp. CUG 92003]|uniref:N-acetylmuramoyl-L-alanine amidase n=1 Tax=Thalassobacillus sp. CUG 92003 TaxID=2736641 RepID=UPI0015E7621C|nr:N-acetylmuramoyl-L-alanine amidase [Thalassobacillus sp. CUG 92003]
MAKIWYSITFIAVFLILLGSSASSIQANEVLVEVDTLNVRSGPGLDYNQTGTVHQDDTFSVQETKEDWVKINWNDTTGWIAKQHVQFQEEHVTTCNVDHLRIRSEATTQSAIKGYLMEGDEVELLEQRDNWLHISYEGVNGWIHRDYTALATKPSDNRDTSNSSDTSVNAEQSIATLQYNATNLRAGPSTNHKVIGQRDAGERFDVIEKQNDWYHIQTENGTAYVAGWLVSIKGSSQSETTNQDGLKNKTVMIDPGHGGRDSGTIGINGTYEKTLNLDTALTLMKKLEQSGANVLLTRDDDQYLSLAARSSFANTSKPDAFISLHYNSAPHVQNASGISTFYNGNENEHLANMVHIAMIDATGMTDRGYSASNYHMIREPQVPSLLLELGFLSTSYEEQYVQTSAYQENVTDGIHDGLKAYFTD